MTNRKFISTFSTASTLWCTSEAVSTPSSSESNSSSYSIFWIFPFKVTSQVRHTIVQPFHPLYSLRLPSRNRIKNFEHFSASKESYSTNRRHQQIRRREGTEIFDGRKPDIMHYVEPPQLEQQRRNYAGLIDERTPSVTEIVRESSVPDVIVGVIGH